jgi:hypothetical protein
VIVVLQAVHIDGEVVVLHSQQCFHQWRVCRRLQMKNLELAYEEFFEQRELVEVFVMTS